jgi:hypothetical protein
MDFPSAIKGGLEVAINEDWRGIPIETLGMQFRPKELRAKNTTPELYKKMGNKYLSPAQIHHLSNSFLGLYGRMIDDLMIATLWDEKEKGERVFAKYNPLDYLSSRIQGREVESRTKFDDIFYERYNEIMQTYNKVSDFRKTKNKEAIEEFRTNKEERALYSLKEYTDKVQNKLSQIKKAIENIENGKTAARTQEQKEKEINRLLLIKHNMVEQAVENIEDKISRGKK